MEAEAATSSGLGPVLITAAVILGIFAVAAVIGWIKSNRLPKV